MIFTRYLTIVSFLATLAVIQASSDVEEYSDFGEAHEMADGFNLEPLNIAAPASVAAASSQLAVHEGESSSALTRFSINKLRQSIMNRSQRKAEAAKMSEAREQERLEAEDAMRKKLGIFKKTLPDAQKKDILKSLISKYFHFHGCNDYKSYFNAEENTARRWTGDEYSSVILTVTQSKGSIYDFKVCWQIPDLDYYGLPSTFKTALVMKFDNDPIDISREEVSLNAEKGENCHIMKSNLEHWKPHYERAMQPDVKLSVTMIDGNNGNKRLGKVTFVPKISFHSKELLGSDEVPDFTRRLAILHRQGTINKDLFDYARDNGRPICLFKGGAVSLTKPEAKKKSAN